MLIPYILAKTLSAATYQQYANAITSLSGLNKWISFPGDMIRIESLQRKPWVKIHLLIHRSRDKMAANFLTFSNVFSWTKTYMYKCRVRFHWSLFLRSNNIPALVQIMAWPRPGDKPLSEPMMISLVTHICVMRHQSATITCLQWV